MKLISMAAAGALALMATASYAQPAPADPAAAHDQRTHQRPDPAQRAEHHAQKLRDALQLRPDQEPALRALVAATAMRGQHEHEHGQQQAALSTPERLDHMRARLAEHQARFDEHATAIKRFYAQLSPTQQRAFDAMGPMGEGRHGKHGGHEHGRG